MLSDEVLFCQRVGKITGEDDLLNARGLVQGDNSFFVLRVRMETGRFRDDHEVAVSWSGRHDSNHF